MITIWIRPRSANVSTVETNSNETTLEANSHADTTCLVGGGGLKLFDYECLLSTADFDSPRPEMGP